MRKVYAGSFISMLAASLVLSVGTIPGALAGERDLLTTAQPSAVTQSADVVAITQEDREQAAAAVAEVDQQRVAETAEAAEVTAVAVQEDVDQAQPEPPAVEPVPAPEPAPQPESSAPAVEPAPVATPAPKTPVEKSPKSQEPASASQPEFDEGPSQSDPDATQESELEPATEDTEDFTQIIADIREVLESLSPAVVAGIAEDDEKAIEAAVMAALYAGLPQYDASEIDAALVVMQAESTTKARPMQFKAYAVENATVHVNVGGTRGPGGGVNPLEGARLQLFQGGDSGPNYSQPYTQPWATCDSNANGVCTFTIPDTQALERECVGGIEFFDCWLGTWVTITPEGENHGIRPWIVLVGFAPGSPAAADYRIVHTPPAVTTGASSSLQSTDYTFRLATSDTEGNATSQYPQVGTGNNNRTASGGIWPVSRHNIGMAQQCGGRIGLLIDVSTSLQGSQQQLRDSAAAFVNALAGTPTELGIWTFGTNSPSTGSGNTTMLPVSLTSPAGVTQALNKAANITVPNSNGTNWDAGFRRVEQDTRNNPLDVLMVLTDGNPTYYQTGSTVEGPGSFTRFREAENAIFSANAVKANGTHIFVVGIGSDITQSINNLRLVSGPTLNEDYSTTTNYTQLGQMLKDMVSANCDGSLNVTKLVIPHDGDIDDAQTREGWDFTATSPHWGAGVELTQATGATGATSFELEAIDGTAPVTVTEDPGDYSLVAVNGSNAVCADDDGNAVSVTNTTNGFTVNVSENQFVNCRVYNQEPTPAVSMVVHKTWVINGETFDHFDADRPVGTAQLQLDGTNRNFSDSVGGFQFGDTVTISETVGELPPHCVNTASGDLGAVTLGETADNVFEIVNTVNCETTLTLRKNVLNGPADASAWTLGGTVVTPGVTDALPAPTGQDTGNGVTANVTPGVVYALHESGGPDYYAQYVDPNANLYTESTGTWNCVALDADGNPIPGLNDGLNGGVTVSFGYHFDCTADNYTAELVLLKQVHQVAGGTMTPDQWNLHSAPTDVTADPRGTQTVTGTSSSADQQVLYLKPRVAYELSETTGPGQGHDRFVQTGVTCANATDFDAEEAQLQVDDARRVTCTFHNAEFGFELEKRGWDFESITPGVIPGSGEIIGDGSVTVPEFTSVSWTYEVTNTGVLPLIDITLVDDRLAPTALTCPSTTLAGETSMICTAGGVITASP